jgi:hypothetical protein
VKRAPPEADATINLSGVRQAADLPESPLRRQRRYRAIGRAGFAAGARGYCDKYGKPKDVHRPSHVIALANWFVSADP